MKKLLSIILVILLVGTLLGCHYSESGDILEPVEFFYPRKSTSFVYGATDGVITSEIREASGHIGDLNYLLSMYLRGPQTATLRSPFPVGCRLEDIRAEDDTLNIRLSSEFASLDGTELTLACAGLAKTCFSISECAFICIDAVSDEKTISMVLHADSLMLSDYSAFEPQAAEAPQ